MSELRFKDGRTMQTSDTGALYMVYLDKDGKEYKLTRTETGAFEETSYRQLASWGCDRGHRWWADPDNEAPQCWRCENMARILSKILR